VPNAGTLLGWPSGEEVSRAPFRLSLITAYGDAETKRRALEGGAETLLTKPIDFAALRSEIESRVQHAA
jgi:response regulator RpfG family c-di-GMP phosphodiesterase